MYRKRAVFSAGLLILIISISAANLFAQVQVSAQVSNSIYVDPAEVAAVPVGGSFSIGVNAFGVSGVNALEIRLAYDTSILDCTGTSEGPFLPSGGLTFYSYVIDEAMGIVMISSLLLDPLATVSGDGVLSNIAFTVTSEGSSVLDIGLWNSGPAEPHNWLLGIGGTQIVHESSNGLYNPGVPLHNVAVTVLTAPATATVGETVPISVDVENIGNQDETVIVTVTVDGTTLGTDQIPLTLAAPTATLSYSWNTTGLTTGEYTITAEATIVGFADHDYSDNVRTALITLIPVTNHDVAVTAITAPATAYVGDVVSMSVDVANLGDFDETVDVTVTVDGTTLGTDQIPLTLAAPTATLSYSWNTTGLTTGEYTITATATVALDDVPDNNEMTATINLKELVMYHAMLVKRAAWPEHHNFRPLRDDDGYNTLGAKIYNNGTEATFVRARFEIDEPGPEDSIGFSNEIMLASGATVNVYFDYLVDVSLTGKYYITAICQYEVAPDVWIDSTTKVKTFSFAIKG